LASENKVVFFYENEEKAKKQGSLLKILTRKSFGKKAVGNYFICWPGITVPKRLFLKSLVRKMYG
jgi:hypothetical protein